MFKKILPYELARILLLAGEAACVVAVAYGAVRTVWFISQWILSPFSLELMLQAAGALPKKVAFVGKIVEFFATDLTAQEAKEAVTKYATYVIIGVAVLIVLRWLLKLLERGFRQKFMPYVLKEDFSDFTYESKKRKAAEETLCDVGLLGRAERYYTANRLQGLYRDCWVAAEEIVCGGVYGENYTSHKDFGKPGHEKRLLSARPCQAHGGDPVLLHRLRPALPLLHRLDRGRLRPAHPADGRQADAAAGEIPRSVRHLLRGLHPRADPPPLV